MDGGMEGWMEGGREDGRGEGGREEGREGGKKGKRDYKLEPDTQLCCRPPNKAVLPIVPNVLSMCEPCPTPCDVWEHSCDLPFKQ